MCDKAPKWLELPLEALNLQDRVATLGGSTAHKIKVNDEAGNPVTLDEESIGGGGIFAMVAARMFLPASRCAMIVDEGEDFPDRFKKKLLAFGQEMIWFRKRSGKTTRALNIYTGPSIGEGHQSFRYLCPQKKLWLEDLMHDTSPFADPPPKWIHVVCTTERASEIIVNLTGVRNGHCSWSPQLVWEPLGSSCAPENLKAILCAAIHFAVFSPNLLELQSILGITTAETRSAAERAACVFRRLLVRDFPDRPIPAIIVRAGRLGSITVSERWQGWVPAYWREDEQDRVVDATGGGNAWLGGLCAGLVLTQGDMRAASMFAATASSFAIQQRGLPHLTTREGVELWNEVDPWSRLSAIALRMRDVGQETHRPRA